MSLEQFVILGSKQRGRALEALVQQVLNNKKIFVFGELLALPSVQELAGTEYDKTFHCLELFAYGTYQDYVRAPTMYIELTDAMRTKLRQLTIVSLAADNKILSYETLRRELEIDNVRTLEDLIIETIYADLIKGKLDQKGEIFRIKGTMGRDVRPEKLGSIIELLQAWKVQCEALVTTVNASSADAIARREDTKLEQEDVHRAVAEVKSSLKESLTSGNIDELGGGQKIRVGVGSSFGLYAGPKNNSKRNRGGGSDRR